MAEPLDPLTGYGASMPAGVLRWVRARPLGVGETPQPPVFEESDLPPAWTLEPAPGEIHPSLYGDTRALAQVRTRLNEPRWQAWRQMLLKQDRVVGNLYDANRIGVQLSSCAWAWTLTGEWLTQFCGLPAISELAGRSGTGVHLYLRSDFKPEYGLKPGQTILQKIAAERYDYVVLQVPAEFINGAKGEEHDRSLDVYCKAIREAGGLPVIYEMGWKRDDKADEGRRKIFAAAVRNRVTHFAPCSTAWQRVRSERPELELQNPPDRAHPGTLGCYLNLCCFHAALTGREPTGLPLELSVWRHLDDQQKAEAQKVVEQTEFDEYDAALPSWMKRLVAAAKLESLDQETAVYLQRVAWEEYQQKKRRLAEAGDR